MDCARPARRASGADVAPRSFEPDFSFDRHSDAQAMVGVLTRLEADAYRQSLHHFDVIAGGVFRRHQAVLLAARTADAFDITLVVAANRIDVNRRALAGPHPANLRLLKIGGDPDVVERNDREEQLTRLHAFSILDGFFPD